MDMWYRVDIITYLRPTPTPGQIGRHFTNGIARYIFVNEKFCILIKIALNFGPEGPLDNSPSLA